MPVTKVSVRDRALQLLVLWLGYGALIGGMVLAVYDTVELRAVIDRIDASYLPLARVHDIMYLVSWYLLGGSGGGSMGWGIVSSIVNQYMLGGEQYARDAGLSDYINMVAPAMSIAIDGIISGIGVGTILRKKWAWYGNIAIKSISLPMIFTGLLVLFPWWSFTAILMLILNGLALYALCLNRSIIEHFHQKISEQQRSGYDIITLPLGPQPATKVPQSSKRLRYSVIVIVSLSLFVTPSVSGSVAGLIHAKSNIHILHPSEESCKALPVYDTLPEWSLAESTCIVVGRIELDQDSQVVVSEGVVLKITPKMPRYEQYGSIINEGKIFNFGSIVIEHATVINHHNGILDNRGTMSLGGITNSAEVEFTGVSDTTVDNYSKEGIVNFGLFNNSAVIRNNALLENAGGHFYNMAGAEIGNDGLLLNSGYFHNHGVIINANKISNKEIIWNMGQITGHGMFESRCGYGDILDNSTGLVDAKIVLQAPRC